MLLPHFLDTTLPARLQAVVAGVEPRTFTFDYSYQSHDGFEVDDDGVSIPAPGSNYASQRMVFNDLGQGVLNNAFEGKTLAEGASLHVFCCRLT